VYGALYRILTPYGGIRYKSVLISTCQILTFPCTSFGHFGTDPHEGSEVQFDILLTSEVDGIEWSLSRPSLLYSLGKLQAVPVQWKKGYGLRSLDVSEERIIKLPRTE
jgi:hypothetical protein